MDLLPYEPMSCTWLPSGKAVPAVTVYPETGPAASDQGSWHVMVIAADGLRPASGVASQLQTSTTATDMAVMVMTTCGHCVVRITKPRQCVKHMRPTVPA